MRFHNIIQKCVSDGKENDSLLENCNHTLYVRHLNCVLRHVGAERRFALDETPLTPDAPLLKSITTNSGVVLCQGRTSIWTLLPVLRADGTVLSTCVLQRCKSIPVDAIKFCSSNSVIIGATENAQQTDEMWLKFAEQWLPLCGTS